VMCVDVYMFHILYMGMCDVCSVWCACMCVCVVCVYVYVYVCVYVWRVCMWPHARSYLAPVCVCVCVCVVSVCVASREIISGTCMCMWMWMCGECVRGLTRDHIWHPYVYVYVW